MDWTVETVLESWVADPKLSRRKIAFLEQFHKHQLHGAVHDMIGFMPAALRTGAPLTNDVAAPFLAGRSVPIIDGNVQCPQTPLAPATHTCQR